MNVRTTLTGLVAATLLLGCQPAAPKFTPADEAAVRAVFDGVVTDIRAANWTSWGARFAEDAVFHPTNGPALVGRAAIVEWAKGFPPIETFAFSNYKIAGDGSLAWGTSAIALKLKDLPADTQKQLVVLRRNASGAWEVLAVSLSSDTPLPMPAPAAPAAAAKTPPKK